MKKLCICLAVLISLCGCGGNTENTDGQTQQNQTQETAPVSSPVYVTPSFSDVEMDSVTDLKCSVRYSNGEKLVFENDKAKQLYSMVTEFEKTELKEVSTKEIDYVALLFESSETGTEIEKGYIVYSNDEMEETINPYVMSMDAYKLANGTYQTVLDKIIELS